MLLEAREPLSVAAVLLQLRLLVALRLGGDPRLANGRLVRRAATAVSAVVALVVLAAAAAARLAATGSRWLVADAVEALVAAFLVSGALAIAGALGAAGAVRWRRLDTLTDWPGAALGALTSTLFVESAVASAHGLAALAVDASVALRTGGGVGAIVVADTARAAEVGDHLADEVVPLRVVAVLVTGTHARVGGGALVVVGAGTGRLAPLCVDRCKDDGQDSDGEGKCGASGEGHCG